MTDPQGKVPDPDDIKYDVAGILRLTQIAEQLARVDMRETNHYNEHSGKLTALVARLTEIRQALAALDGFPERVAELAAQVGALAAGPEAEGDDEPPFWLPAPTLRWWQDVSDPDLGASERGKILAERDARLRDIVVWVKEVFRPGYGHLAAALPDCWAEHIVLVHMIDTLAAMWLYLYGNPKRGPATVRDQLELQTRYLPALATQFAAEKASCAHGKDAAK